MTTRFAGRGPLRIGMAISRPSSGPAQDPERCRDCGQGQTYRLTIQAEARQDGLLPPTMRPSSATSAEPFIDYDGKATVMVDKLHLRRHRTISGSGSLTARPSVSAANSI
jgi:hypothetical protein